MSGNIQNPIGGLWLKRFAGLGDSVFLPVQSGINSRRKTVFDEKSGQRYELYQAINCPDNTPQAHLAFYLRHEIPDLAFLYQIFNTLGGDFVQDWINREPTGQYARRVAFLYEWLTGEELTVPSNLNGNYIDALDSKKVLTADKDKTVKNSRWRVNNNLAGNRYFCPTIIKTPSFEQAISLDIDYLIKELNNEFGEDLLARSSVYLTLGESRASFQIEGEGQATSRIQRFAEVIARHTGQGDLPIFPKRLSELQQAILGDKTLLSDFGLRQSPVFIGQSFLSDEVVHYIAPVDRLSERLNGLQDFWNKTTTQSPVLRCAVLAFGFVYIHPLADGNGRLHRFLLNDSLHRDGVLPNNMILPFSSTITQSAAERKRYADILETISKPLMQHIQGFYNFDKQRKIYADGIRSNLIFEDTTLAEPFWRYPNLTPHIEYISALIKTVVEHNMREQSQYLQKHEQTREKLKELAEMPNDYADRIIRSICENKGQLSNKLIKEFDFLKDNQDLWQRMITVVKTAFEDKSNS